MKLSKTSFGYTRDKQEVFLFTLENDKKMTVKVTNYGAIITSIQVPDRNGNIEEIVTGFDSMEEYQDQFYLDNCPYFGCVAGRYANRIDKGSFELDGQKYQLPINNGPNSLHGGIIGFDKKVWDATPLEGKEEVAVRFKLLSHDGEEGYPGNLTVTVTYRLNNDNELTIEYDGVSDKPTIINLTNHTYFNLTGFKKPVHDHELKIEAGYITEITSDLIPTGKLLPVEDTLFDFRNPRSLRQGLEEMETGYDHNIVLSKSGEDPEKAAEVYEPESGRVLEVFTTHPGMQLYTGYWVSDKLHRGAVQYGPYCGFCLETQNFPDAINHKNFPSCVLRPGEEYQEETIFKFSTK